MKQRCYVFDIDGTLADCTHRLHHIQKQPKDWRSFFAECSADKPIQHMIGVATALSAIGAQIVYVSGRSDECRVQTVAWLDSHELPYGPVYMRRSGDHRDDDILKIELLADLRADGFEPIMAFDDRSRVVAAWRNAGIPCAQVAPGDF
jgi:phosphoglycolate phosphatase-like HAD superfamily hydrolase